MFDSDVVLTISRIANGFIARDTDGVTTYCADHTAVADYVLSTSMKEKLSVPKSVIGKQLSLKFNQPN